MKVPLNKLVLRKPVSAGMDLAVIGHFVMIFRKSTLPCDPPILVRRLKNGHWKVMDGRHRFFAAVIAGRTEIEAVEEV